ncbi:hypothetical protein CLOM_g6851 [Closterium sp. NIES-68]|nr:hypothetical protein CLOM_g6851 [Closterium sp. NIES-68]GJP72387.1 hypothetical protein CLOP_g3125 [Closterium sp. NIES-67]
MHPLPAPRPASIAHCRPSLSASDEIGPSVGTAGRACASSAHPRSRNAPPLAPPTKTARVGGNSGAGRLCGDGEWRNKALAVTRGTNESQTRRRRGTRCSMSSPAQRPYVTVLIVPTGVGAEIGGFAGDALPVARAFSGVADCLIAHPNVLNGAMLYWPLPRALYVEGHALDRFARGEWGLQPAHGNRVGLVFDQAVEDHLLLRHLQVADAARATLGIDIVGYTVTDRPLKVHKWVDMATGASTGRIDEADSLLRAVQTLLDAPLAVHPPSHAHPLSPASPPARAGGGVDAVGIVARFPDDGLEALQQYREGQGVDVLGGVEAVISHLVVSHFQLPAAHAPALAPLPLLPSIAPRSAAEEIGHTFLPCVLAGLSRAPRLISRHAPPTAAGEGRREEVEGRGQERVENLSSIPTSIDATWDYTRDVGSGISSISSSSGGSGGSGVVWAEDVDCVVLPVDAFGGHAAQALAHRQGGAPLFIAVEENSTVMDDPPSKFAIPAVVVRNYWEALGVMAAHKAGVSPWALRRHAVSHIPRIHPTPP